MMSQKPASIFRKMLNRMIEARAREASRHINRALKAMDDEGLIERGIERGRNHNQRFNLN